MRSLIRLLMLWTLSAPLMAAPAGDDFELAPHADKVVITSFQYLSESGDGEDLQALANRNDWKTHTGDTFSFGFAKESYWFTFQIHEQALNPRRWIVEIPYPPLDIIDFWIVDSKGAVRHKTVGDLLPFEARDIHYRSPNFVLQTHGPELIRVFMRIRTESSIQGSIIFWDPERFISKASDELMAFALFIGIMLALTIYNFFLFLRIREPGYLYYVFFVFFHAYTNFSVFGLAFQYVTPGWPRFSSAIIPVCISFASIFAISFSLEFLRLPAYSRGLTRFFKILQAWGIATAAISLASYRLGITSSTLLTLAGAPFLLLAGVICKRKGYRPAGYFVLAFSVFLIGLFVHQLIPLGVLEPGPFTTYSTYVGSTLEMLLLSMALGDKMKFEQNNSRRLIERLNLDLQAEHRKVMALNEQLEARVEAQTRDIRSMMQHIRLGIFTVIDDGVIHKDYSAYLEQIFQSKDLGGTRVVDLFYSRHRDPLEGASRIASILQATLGEPAYAFEMNEAALIKDFIWTAKTGEQKILEVDWSPMLDREDCMEKILVTVRDVTQFRELQAMAEGKKKELEFIAEIVPIPREQFARFLSSGEKQVEENGRLIAFNAHRSQEALKIIFINLHTLKGTARSLGFQKLAERVHAAEHFITTLQKEGAAWDQARLLQDHQSIKEIFEYYRHVNDHILERTTARNSIEIEISKVESILRDVSRMRGSLDAEMARDFLQKIDQILGKSIYQSAAQLFQEIFGSTAQLARDLGKEPPKHELVSGAWHFSQEGAEILRNIFSHLLRNSMDHGVESRHERLKAGKPAEGKILVELHEEHDGLSIRYRDDGRGLALRTIRELAIIHAFIESTQILPPEEIAQLIFLPGFSTSQSVTEISGRGVGMPAIKNYVEKAGGQLRLDLLPCSDERNDFRNFVITILLPARFYRSFQGSSADAAEHAA